MGDETVLDGMARDQQFGVVGHLRDVVPRSGACMADFHAATAQIHQFAVLEAIAPRAGSECDAVASDMPHDALVEQDLTATNDGDRCIKSDFCLGKGLPGCGQDPVAMRKAHAPKLDVFHPALARQIPLKFRASVRGVAQPRGLRSAALPLSVCRSAGRLAGPDTTAPVR